MKRKTFNQNHSAGAEGGRAPAPKEGTRRGGLREQHAEATRQALVTAAALRFAAHGYVGTSLDDVAADAGSTKGAVYHHFKDKRALFEATYEHLSSSLVHQLVQHPLMASGAVGDAIAVFLALAPDPSYSRVLFLEGPAVLGPALCRDIDMRHGLGLMEALVSRLITPEMKAQVSSTVLTRLMLATLIEAVQMIAMAADQTEADALARQASLVLSRSFGALSAGA
ncbi:TetR family transcriptional regulator [Aquabacterium sp. A3]|uniref:TetR/AcrR family transcriptional regulator n=1 Tax=Aquabacterium sp. A3 TaxID=3132829 RepID=UPI0031197002